MKVGGEKRQSREGRKKGSAAGRIGGVLFLSLRKSTQVFPEASFEYRVGGSTGELVSRSSRGKLICLKPRRKPMNDSRFDLVRNRTASETLKKFSERPIVLLGSRNEALFDELVQKQQSREPRSLRRS